MAFPYSCKIFTDNPIHKIQIPGLDIKGIFVLADGTVLLSGYAMSPYGGNYVMSLAPSGQLPMVKYW